MTELASLLDAVDPVSLRSHAGGDAVAVAACARELVFGRDLDQRVPVVGGVDLGRFEWSLGRLDGQLYRLAGA